jgi:hypothetical protein
VSDERRPAKRRSRRRPPGPRSSRDWGGFGVPSRVRSRPSRQISPSLRVASPASPAPRTC